MAGRSAVSSTRRSTTPRVRALEISARHAQADAVEVFDYVTATFPFRIREIRTDDGHAFPAKFHWRVEDQGVRHASVKPSPPRPDGEVARSRRSDAQELHQLLGAEGDVDLEAKLQDWARLHDLARPHGAHDGKTPYEAPGAKP